ncbi:MAG TPA: ROK family protein [Stellaceae bacterium]|nr:ROK family protein [Stellaceae bacterium]
MRRGLRIGIDLGGTKIEAIALDAAGAVRLRRRVPTPAGDYDGILDAVAALVAETERELGEQGTVGVATPGALSTRTGLIKNSNSTALNGKPLDRDLALRLGRPVRLENDANCFALSEAVDGAAADARVVFGVILGTGVGGGIVIGKSLLGGRNRIAGEWGHNPLPWAHDDERPGAACYCGRAGCIETFLSGAGLLREFRRQGGDAASAEDIASAAARGDGAASAALDRYEDRLARSLAALINILDPDTIVLGGGLSNIARLYERVPPLVGRYAFSDRIDTPIRRAKHGDSSGVRGAAWLWPANG